MGLPNLFMKGRLMRIKILGALAGFFLGLILAQACHGEEISISTPPPSVHIVSLDYNRAITDCKEGKLYAMQIEASMDVYKRTVETSLAKLPEDDKVKRDRVIEDANIDLNNLKSSKLKTLNSKVAKKLQTFSDEHKYFLVLHKNVAVLYSTKTTDITDKFIEYLDK